MANRNSGEESSLELLLDTITNSFGGIVFIAILTILLLQRTSPVQQIKQLANENQHSEMIRSQTMLQEAEAELASLRQAAQAQSATQERFSSAETQAEFQRIQQEREELARLKDAQRHAVQDRAKLQAEENDLLANREKLVETLHETKQKADAIALQLKDLERTRSKDAPIPRARESKTYQSISLVLKNRKLYFALDYSRGATFARFNTAEFLVTGEETKGTVFTPNPVKGFLVSDAASLETYLQQKLALVETSRFHADLAVWTDSFAEFQILKSVLIRMNLQYRIIVMNDSETLSFGGSDRTVQ